ncbi:hypothetical protein PanWU01x14_077690 [Parasponia andersonii]|uniref:Uncharacterized protein n=1 Tax=Parasponia andersonii TaxID=3476 RepID=A0A2P5DBS2_PARAD|nr:hypothetical protein PanWU01x14_077690 [Parasponia andersonii]
MGSVLGYGLVVSRDSGPKPSFAKPESSSFSRTVKPSDF